MSRLVGPPAMRCLRPEGARAFSRGPAKLGSTLAMAMAMAVGAALAVALAVVSSGLSPEPAFAAASGSDGPGGTVTVGVTGSGSSVGSPGGASRAGGAPGPGSGTPWICSSLPLTLNDGPGIAPGGPTPGGWYSVTCINGGTGASTTTTEWIAAATPPTTPAVDPRLVALQAENSLRLPAPTVGTDPAGSSVVNLDTWLWIDPIIWFPHSVTAAVGSVQATAVATPVAVAWTMGDGGTAICSGPGTVYNRSEPSGSQSTDCSYRYRASSAGQASPDGNPDHAAFTVRAIVHWSVTWTAVGAPGGGSLPPLTTVGVIELRVEQVESVNTDRFVLTTAREQNRSTDQ